MVLDPFTITELGVCVVGVLGALIGVCRVSQCETISCGWTGFKCVKGNQIIVSDVETELDDIKSPKQS
jgi:hypothetical protein